MTTPRAFAFTDQAGNEIEPDAGMLEAVERAWAPGPAGAHGVVPVGKYRGQPLDVLTRDPGYCRWMLDTPDLLARYPHLGVWLAEHPPGDSAVPAPGPLPETVAARYEYRDDRGALCYTVVRHEPKRFTVEAPDGTPLPDPIPRETAVLYRLPELLAAPPGETVYVAEGERDADTLAGLGLVAVTMPCGTRMGWQDSYTPHLAGRHVVILPDADGPGRKHAGKVLDAVAGAARSCVIVDLHQGQRGPWDVTDWLTRRARGRDDLLAQAAKARMESAGYTWRPAGPVKADRETLVWGSTLDSTGKLVLLAICHLTPQGGMLPPASRIASACSLHRVTAQHAVTRLREGGILAPGRDVRVAWDLLAVAV